jgi:hypothetical protein
MPPVVVVPEISLVEPALPADPALRALADDVISRLKYSFAAAATADQQAASGRFDKMFGAFLATRNPTVRAQVREQVRTKLASTAWRSQELGRYAALDMKEYRALGSDRVQERIPPPKVDGAAVKAGTKKLKVKFDVAGKGLLKHAKGHSVPHLGPSQPGPSPPPADPDWVAGQKYTKLRLYVRKVRCVEETDEWGSDEINMGGVGITPEGNTFLIDQFKVSEDFDQGELVEFASKTFAKWKLRTDKSDFPYAYGMTLALAEKDDGGFYQFLKDLWDKVDEAVKAAIGAWIGGVIGGAAGGVLGFIAGAIIGAFVGWLISLFDNKDDIINTKTMVLVLGWASKSYYDWAELTTSEGLVETLNFYGDGGHYRVRMSWKVTAE